MAQLFVWYPRLKSAGSKARDTLEKQSQPHPIYHFVDNVGHASILLDRTYPNAYISWWPNKDRTAFSTPTPEQDVKLEGGPPSFCVSLNCLDETAMRNWWNRLKLDGAPIPYRAVHWPELPRWTLNRSNCSHIVALAMVIGGAESFAKRISFGAKTITPPQLHFWAQRIKLASSVSSALGGN